MCLLLFSHEVNDQLTFELWITCHLGNDLHPWFFRRWTVQEIKECIHIDFMTFTCIWLVIEHCLLKCEKTIKKAAKLDGQTCKNHTHFQNIGEGFCFGVTWFSSILCDRMQNSDNPACALLTKKSKWDKSTLFMGYSNSVNGWQNSSWFFKKVYGLCKWAYSDLFLVCVSALFIHNKSKLPLKKMPWAKCKLF